MSKTTNLEVSQDIVTEEMVQAVTEAIVDEASEREVKVDDIIDEILEEAKETSTSEEKPKRNTNSSKNGKSALDYNSRGFKTLADAISFVTTEKFKKLGKADQEEYLKWLNK